MASESAQPVPAPVEHETNNTAEDNNAPTGGSSDGEGGERTAREKLKKTSIAGLAQFSQSSTGRITGDHPLSDSVTTDALPEQSASENGGPRGRPSKKRSFEDLQQDDHPGPIANGSATLPDPKRNQHKRMRSRDIPGGQVREIGKFEDAGSPVREESDDEGPGGAGVLVDPQTEVDTNAQRRLGGKMLEEDNATSEPIIGVGGPEAVPSVAVHTQQQAQSGNEEHDSKQHSALELPSGFANVSATSPFGAVRSPPTTSNAPSTVPSLPTPTSSSAFASSGLSAFASSDKSPFGASLTTKATGGFGGGGIGFGNATPSSFGGAKPSGFGSTPSAFGSTSSFGNRSTSGFGSTGGFGLGAAPLPFGGAVSSFATAGGASTFGKAKSFGAKSYEADEGSVNEDEERQHDDDDSKPDSRFSQQRVETGEEEEETIFSCRAKLFHFEEKQWKERGVGSLKVNVRYEPLSSPENGDSQDSEGDELEGGITPMVRRGRVLMRTDGVHRVILNSPVFKGMNVGTKDGEEPTGRTMMLTGMEDGKPKGFQLRIGKEEVLKDLYYKIQELKAEL